MRKAAIFLALLGILAAGQALARVDVATDAAAQIELNMRLEIPTNLSLRIGTPGKQVDTVTFNVTGLPETQPRVEGDLHPTIEISSNLPTGCDLSANSAMGMKGNMATIPFTKVSFEGTGALSGIKGSFNGSADQKLQSIAGRGKRQGTMRFTYDNTYKYPPGVYVGTITFTLSTP